MRPRGTTGRQSVLSRRISSTTIFLGRLLGLYLVAISTGMLANRRRTLATLDEMARSGPWMLFSGMVATAAGLAIVLAHNVWSGGALPVVVTLVGFVTSPRRRVRLQGRFRKLAAIIGPK